MGENDSWRPAHVIVKRYGEDASIQTTMRADELLATGDFDGQRTWKQIMRAVEDLQRGTPAPGEAVN